jgi:ribosomal protein L18E
MAKSVGKKESKMVNKIRRSVSNEFVPPSPSRWRVNFERRKEENALEMVVVVVVMVMESDEEEEDIALLAVTPFFS